MSLKIRSRRVVEPLSTLIKITDVPRAYPSLAKGEKPKALVELAKDRGLSVYVVKPSLIFLLREEITKGKHEADSLKDLPMAYTKHRTFLGLGDLMAYANLSKTEATELLSAVHLFFNRIGMEGIPCTELDLMLYLDHHNLTKKGI
jgi:hypothetical protein